MSEVVSLVVRAPQYVYEFNIEKDGAGASTLIARLLHSKFFVNVFAKEMMGEKGFIIGPKERAVIRIFSAESLGVVGWGKARFFGPDGFKHINQFGLVQCLPDDAPYVCLMQATPNPNDWFEFAHNPFSFSWGRPSVFIVGHHPQEGYGVFRNLLSGCQFSSSDLVAVRLENLQH